MMNIRIATPADVDVITEIFLQSMVTIPSWGYRFPYRVQYPDDHRKFVHDLVRRYVSPEYIDWIVVLVEVTPDDTNAQTEAQIAAFAVWELSYVNIRTYGSDYEPKIPTKDMAEASGVFRKDANPKHVAVFEDALLEVKKKFFAPYGSERLYLKNLGTVPAYRRSGFGSALVSWGIEKAAKDGVVVILTSSPQGFGVYVALGFRELGTVIVQAEGEEETVSLNAMVYEGK